MLHSFDITDTSVLEISDACVEVLLSLTALCRLELCKHPCSEPWSRESHSKVCKLEAAKRLLLGRGMLFCSKYHGREGYVSEAVEEAE